MVANSSCLAGSRPAYPATHKVDQVDDYHGVSVADPYRWLEEDTAERAAWVAAQRAITEKHLSQLAARDELRSRFGHLLQYPRYYDMVRRGSSLVFMRNTGLQNQLTLCIQRGLKVTPEVLVDPTRINPGEAVRIVGAQPSWDMRYLAYGLSHEGSDWQEYFVRDMATGHDLPDRLQWVKATAIAWRGDGFYYSRFPAPATSPASSARNENHQVWYHHVNSPQSADTLVYEDRGRPVRFYFVEATEGGQFASLFVFDPESGNTGNALWTLDARAGIADFKPVVTSFADMFRVVGAQDDRLLVLTDRRSPNSRLVLIDPSHPGERNWKELIPECEHALELVAPAGGKLFAAYNHHASHILYAFDKTGRFENELSLPGLGRVTIVPWQQNDRDVLWSFTSFTIPATIYRYDIATRASEVVWNPVVRFNPDDMVTHRVFVPSKDGTRIPMFIVHRKGVARDGSNRAVLEGYGGNGMSVGPSFDPLRIALLERGVVYALASLRGGGEYGETWHRSGSRESKQNVFDDCVAAAEWLQANGYTNRRRCALIGTSNGGLLVGAVMTQRPDLFQVALPCGGVLDMLRFHRFTIGWSGVAEYGTSDDPTMFPVLLAYSPVHNVRAEVSYPATLVVTSEHDDHVVPAHSFKFIAALQDRAAGVRPYLIRIDSKSGHSPVSLPKAIDERADLYAFMLAHTEDGAD